MLEIAAAAQAASVSPWLTFGTAVAGGAVAATAALGGVWLAQRKEDRRAQRADRQHVRDTKADRLREIYKPLVAFSLIAEQVASESSYVLEGETVEVRDDRHQRQLREALSEVGKIYPSALVEPETQQTVDAYTATATACDQYLRSLRTNAQVPGTTSMDRLREQYEAIRVSAAQLRAKILEHLAKMEQAI